MGYWRAKRQRQANPGVSIVVLASGGGSNFQALLDDDHVRPYLSALICNRPGAGCLARAETAGLSQIVINHSEFDSRDAFDTALGDQLSALNPDWIVMAGFMRILGEDFMRRFDGKMVNIHPSLLPKYKGLHTHQRALDAGDSQAGVSVHWATAELDGGPLIGQRSVTIQTGDDASTLAARVLQQEHQLYPAVCRALIQGRLVMAPSQTLLDGAPIDRMDHF